jgi:hypothetical protein
MNNVFLMMMPGRGLFLPVTANLAAWYQAEKGITIGTGVSAWADQSGNGNTLTQATGANQPAYSATGGSNGTAMVTFDGSNDTMSTAGFTLAQPNTYYLLAKQISWVLGGTFLDGVLPAANNNVVFQVGAPGAGASPDITFFSGTRIGPIDPSLGQWCVITAVANGASSEIRLNMAASIAADAGNAFANPGGITIGSRATPSDWGNVAFTEFLCYTAAHNTATQDLIIRYLMRRAGL